MRPFLPLLIAVCLAAAGCGGTRFMQPGPTKLAAPEAGKVLVNFHRPSNYGGVQDCPVFDATTGKMIGNIQGKQLFQYQCAPGERMFIAWGEHKSAVKGALVADKVYDVVVDVGMGIWKASVSIRAVTKSHEKRAEVLSWQGSESLIVFVPNADSDKYTADRAKDLAALLSEFTAKPTDRVTALAADDAR